MSMLVTSRERNRSCSPVSRRSRGRIWFLAKSFPDERITNQVCKESPFASPFSGKFDYVYIPFPDSKSMTWEFFTEDSRTSGRLAGLPEIHHPLRGRRHQARAIHSRALRIRRGTDPPWGQPKEKKS